MYVRTYVGMYVCMYACACAHACVCVCLCLWRHVWLCSSQALYDFVWITYYISNISCALKSTLYSMWCDYSITFGQGSIPAPSKKSSRSPMMTSNRDSVHHQDQTMHMLMFFFTKLAALFQAKSAVWWRNQVYPEPTPAVQPLLRSLPWKLRSKMLISALFFVLSLKA